MISTRFTSPHTKKFRTAVGVRENGTKHYVSGGEGVWVMEDFQNRRLTPTTLDK